MRLSIEKSPSDLATCSKCFYKIGKGTIRLMERYKVSWRYLNKRYYCSDCSLSILKEKINTLKYSDKINLEEIQDMINKISNQNKEPLLREKKLRMLTTMKGGNKICIE